jgi:surface protein
MGYMFYGASSFNQPLDSWVVSSVTNMHRMFYKAENFNQNISNWDVSNVVDCGDFATDSSLSEENMPKFTNCNP